MAEDLLCGCGRTVNWVAYDPLTGLSSCQHCRKQWVEQPDKMVDNPVKINWISKYPDMANKEDMMANVVKTIYEYKCLKCGLKVISNVKLEGKPKGKSNADPLCTRRIGKPKAKICGGVLKFVSERSVDTPKKAPKKPTSKLD